MKYINIHTHNHKTVSKTVSVINLFPKDITKITENKLYSVGLHPWYVNEKSFEDEIFIVEKYSSHKQVVAIGEIGLDKLKEEFNLQMKVFELQVDIAILQNKPIIIHCVKAFAEVIKILKAKKFKNTVIIHRFSGNMQQANQLIKLGYYLSFGDILFNVNSKTTKAFAEIPSQNVFFETDDSNSRIADIYNEAARIKSIETVKLEEQIYLNFKKVFSDNV